jgi:23S rRNA (guanosine2251-2'-O)-methyltransferase
LARKPDWVVNRERARKASDRETVWLFGHHAVRDALLNPAREKRRLVVTRNALDKLADAASAGPEPEIVDARRFPDIIERGSVHQGAVLEVRPLHWGSLEDVCGATGPTTVVLLDRVSDPHNVGAILRSAEVFGARAVVAPRRHSAPETGALAKAASGALERQPYLRVVNLGAAMEALRGMGYAIIGFDGAADDVLHGRLPDGPLALALGAEGAGLRERTRALCDRLVRIPSASAFGSLNVSNAAAVGLYAAALRPVHG